MLHLLKKLNICSRGQESIFHLLHRIPVVIWTTLIDVKFRVVSIAPFYIVPFRLRGFSISVDPSVENWSFCYDAEEMLSLMSYYLIRYIFFKMCIFHPKEHWKAHWRCQTRVPPLVSIYFISMQFLANNWPNKKLVPLSGKSLIRHWTVDVHHLLIVHSNEDNLEVKHHNSALIISLFVQENYAQQFFKVTQIYITQPTSGSGQVIFRNLTSYNNKFACQTSFVTFSFQKKFPSSHLMG